VTLPNLFWLGTPKAGAGILWDSPGAHFPKTQGDRVPGVTIFYGPTEPRGANAVPTRGSRGFIEKNEGLPVRVSEGGQGGGRALRAVLAPGGNLWWPLGGTKPSNGG